MTDRSPSLATERVVTPVAVVLHHAQFSDRYLEDEELAALDEQAPYDLSLALARLSPLHLSVALTFAAGDGFPYTLAIQYVVDFEMSECVPEDRREDVWRDAASRWAPAILYPYVRELATNLTARWIDAPLVLPLVPATLSYNPEDLEIPPPPRDAVGQVTPEATG